jgi:hypothetical protein
MQNEKPSFKERPHAVLKLVTTDGKTRYAVAQLDEHGNYLERHDKAGHVTVIGKYDNYNIAQTKRMELGRLGNHRYHGAHGSPLARSAIKLPEFLPELPTSPRERRELFLNLEIEEQEEALYAISLATGMRRHVIAKWLFVTLEEIEHIDMAITDAARAELDLRIAKKMIGHALSTNSANTITPTLYLTKVFCGWNENGINDGAPEPDMDAAKSLFEDMKVVDTHRDENGNTVAPPTVLSIVRDKKAS